MSKSTTKTRITVEVTERDIDRAHKNDSYNCVVAQAVARTVPDATRIEVDTQSIRFTTEGERRIYMTPYAVQGYVIAFYAGDPIEPFSFQLRDPKRVARHPLTDAGREAKKVSMRARRQRSKEASTDDVDHHVNEPPSGDSSGVAAAKEAYREARVSQAEAPTRKTDGGGRKSPPRVFKKKQRSYGHRLLRINQES